MNEAKFMYKVTKKVKEDLEEQQKKEGEEVRINREKSLLMYLSVHASLCSCIKRKGMKV